MENDGPQKADCIWVLGGDEFGSRIIKAAQLAQAGYAPFVLVDGTPTLDGYECDSTIKYAESKGYAASLFRPVRLPPGVDSTGTEVQYVANQILKRDHVQKVLLVTSNYHTKRATHFVRTEVPWLEVRAIPAPDAFFSPGGWWKTRSGKKTFLLEWTKTISEWWGF